MALNVRSLLPNIDEIRMFIVSSNAVIICFTESWLDCFICDLEIENYMVLRKDHNCKGGGVCVHIRADICFHQRIDIKHELEAVWVDILLPKSKPIL
jgi:hypothetical protein